MLIYEIGFILTKYKFEVLIEVEEIKEIFRMGQNLTDLLDGKSFYKELWNRMQNIEIAEEFGKILTNKRIEEEQRKKLCSLREKLEYSYFKFLEILSFAFESKLSITPEAIEQLIIRFKCISERLDLINNILEAVLVELPEYNELFEEYEVDDDEM
ncbi:MAG: hypothetical protein ACTSP5_05230 [Candidatus Heimdallarchaeota archaeon]